LKAETLAEATRPQFTTGAYGFGFQLGRPDEARSYGHGGGGPGMSGILRMYPESGQAVIVLYNLDSPSAPRMGDGSMPARHSSSSHSSPRILPAPFSMPKID